jgi:hypothetical protein
MIVDTGELEGLGLGFVDKCTFCRRRCTSLTSNASIGLPIVTRMHFLYRVSLGTICVERIMIVLVIVLPSTVQLKRMTQHDPSRTTHDDQGI